MLLTEPLWKKKDFIFTSQRLFEGGAKLNIKNMIGSRKENIIGQNVQKCKKNWEI